MRKVILLTSAAALALALALLLTSCFLFIGVPTDLLPLPDIVRILESPQILSCSATPIRTTCDDLYERVCGWYFWREAGVQTPSTGWIYDCRDMWRVTECRYDITIRLTVLDPSDDLDPSKSPRVRIFDSEPAPGGSIYRDCLLDIPRTDVVIESTDVQGSGATKTVTVRLKDVRARFTTDCATFSATLRFAIVFQADSEDMFSTNTCETVVECDRL